MIFSHTWKSFCVNTETYWELDESKPGQIKENPRLVCNLCIITMYPLTNSSHVSSNNPLFCLPLKFLSYIWGLVEISAINLSTSSKRGQFKHLSCKFRPFNSPKLAKAANELISIFCMSHAFYFYSPARAFISETSTFHGEREKNYAKKFIVPFKLDTLTLAQEKKVVKIAHTPMIRG